MKVPRDIERLITEQPTGCGKTRCVSDVYKIKRLLLNTLRSDQVVGFEEFDRWQPHPQFSGRPTYKIVRSDGKRLRVAFTGMTTLQVFSKGDRSHHYRPAELSEKLGSFIEVAKCH